MSFNRYNSQSYTPSAPSLPESYGQDQTYNNNNNNPSSSSYSYGQQQQYHHQQQQPQYGGGNYYGQQQVSSSSSSLSSQGQSWFPPGTHPDVIRNFQMVDRDRSGFIDEFELQQALSSGYHPFNLRTIRLLMFLFKNPRDPLRIGPSEFNALWSCLGQWRGIFERFDKDRSGKIDAAELRDALHSIGYAIPPSVLQVLISKYDDGSGRRVELNFDSFVECGMIVKGLTEKFKEKDPRYTGSATLPYETYMSMIIPFLV